jgi:membrane carboxypeptidase/penicillin-binding protein
MRRVLKVVGILFVAVLACAVGLVAWLYFYTSDLPPVSQLGSFKGGSEPEAQIQSCEGPKQTIAVVPRERVGRYTVASLIAAEGKPDARSPFIELFFPGEGRHTVPYQVQLARSLVCPSRSLNRQLQELRLANAINRAFHQEDVLTIYLNRVYLGPNVYGIEAAAKKYLGKNASDMTLEESAAMVGMIRSPRMYSPWLHPDRATQRRNSILDEMVVEGSISQADADRAKAAQIHFSE